MPSSADLRPVLADVHQLLTDLELDRQWDDLASGAFDDRPTERLDALVAAALATRRAARGAATRVA
jgi:hypothetical protein